MVIQSNNMRSGAHASWTRFAVSIAAAVATTVTAALAESAEPVNLHSIQSAAAVAAIRAPMSARPGLSIRLSVYAEETFLDEALIKGEAMVGEDGIALVSLADLEPGEYSIAAYLDENGDGKLNRGAVLGRPKEPIAFSNGFKPKLRKPRFEETKVRVAPGSVVVIDLDD